MPSVLCRLTESIKKKKNHDVKHILSGRLLHILSCPWASSNWIPYVNPYSIAFYHKSNPMREIMQTMLKCYGRPGGRSLGTPTPTLNDWGPPPEGVLLGRLLACTPTHLHTSDRLRDRLDPALPILVLTPPSNTPSLS